MPFRRPRFPLFQESGPAGRHSGARLCNCAAGTRVSVVDLGVGGETSGHREWGGQQLQTTLAGWIPKVTEKTMYQEGFDLTTSQIHSMRVYGRGWETDGEGLPFRTLEGSGFGPAHRLDIRFESFITNKTPGDTHAHRLGLAEAESGITAGRGNVSIYQLIGHTLVPFNKEEKQCHSKQSEQFWLKLLG